jgi:hypothetical protein
MRRPDPFDATSKFYGRHGFAYICTWLITAAPVLAVVAIVAVAVVVVL